MCGGKAQRQARGIAWRWRLQTSRCSYGTRRTSWVLCCRSRLRNGQPSSSAPAAPNSTSNELRRATGQRGAARSWSAPGGHWPARTAGTGLTRPDGGGRIPLGDSDGTGNGGSGRLSSQRGLWYRDDLDGLPPIYQRSRAVAVGRAHRRSPAPDLRALHRRRRRQVVRPDGGRSWPGLTWPDGRAAVPGMFREHCFTAASGRPWLHMSGS